MLIIVILIVLKLNLRIGSGQLYSLIYYFGVLQYFTSNSYPSTFLQVVIYTFSSFTQLKPLLLGLIRVCFSAEFKGLAHQILFFLHPTFISLVMLSIVGITRCWPRFSTISKQNYLVKAICILLYLSFTSLSETSLTILNFIRFESIQGTYVAVQPTVSYFSLRHHFPYALVALAVQLLIILFLFLMLFSPCLARMQRVNLTRIKPILDEYQSCYKDEYRWFAGYYLAARQFVFLFSLFELGEFGSIFFLQILSIGILVFHAIFQPYRKRWLNVLDIVILGDLAVYSLMNGSTANVVLGSSKALRDAAIHILILIPVFYFFGLCFTNITYRLYRRKKFELSESTVTRAPSKATNKPKPASTTDEPPLFVPMEREPLIFNESSNESDSSERVRVTSVKSHYQALPATTSPSGPAKPCEAWYSRLAHKVHPSKKTSATFNPKKKEVELTDSFATDVYSKKYTTSVVGGPVGTES